jgi:(heptosyl)LPS beta-1,4-glucosyltransferase
VAKISAVINVVKEEASYLPQVLTSLRNFADEIVIVDMTPSDEVLHIGERFGAKVLKHKFVDYVEPVRNFAISKVTGDWVLVVDPDEELSSNLAKRLKEEANKSKADYFRVARKNINFGKWMKYSRWWPDYNIRFFKKGKVSWSEIIHAVPITVGIGVDLPAKEDLAIIHHNYQSIEGFLARMNRYTSVQSQMLVGGSYKFIWTDLIRKPLSEFLSRFFFGQGYRDGLHGLILAFLQAVSELVLYLKVWQSEKFTEQALSVKEIDKEFMSSMKETRWWLFDAKIRSKNFLSAFPLRIYRKFFLKND